MPTGELGVIGMGRTDVDDIFGNELNQYGPYGPLGNFIDVNEMLEPALLSPTRYQRYLEYDEMDDVELVAAALDTYAAEAAHINEHGKVLRVRSRNPRIVEECEGLLFEQLNLNDEIESWYRILTKYGDLFLEKVIDPNEPLYGVLKVNLLSCDTMHRIETTRGRLIEFQQTEPGSTPDLESVRRDIQAYNAQLAANINKAQMYRGRISHYNHTGRAPGRLMAQSGSLAIRFAPEQIAHVRINKHRKGFFPYGVSILYAVRRVARQLKLMEDAMLIYRLVRAPERRIFYIDVGNLPPHQAMTHLERIKNGLKKRKVYNHRTDSVDERVNLQAQDEDYWLPTRPQSQTRVDTLPGGQNLGETSDVIYFQQKLLRGLKLPPFFLGAEDVNLSRLTTSSVYVAFAQRIERIQRAMAQGIKELLLTHLELRGFPLEETVDLQVEMATPNDWREVVHRESQDARLQMLANAAGTNSFASYRALQIFMGYTEEESKEYVREWEREQLRRAIIEKGEDPDMPPKPLEPELEAMAGIGQDAEDEEAPEEEEFPEEAPDVEAEAPEGEAPEEEAPENEEEEEVPEGPGEPDWLSPEQIEILRSRVMAPLDAIDQEEPDWAAE